MRCYYMRDGSIAGVEFLTMTDDEGRITEARALYERNARQRGADGFEVWDGARFVYRFLEASAQRATGKAQPSYRA